MRILLLLLIGYLCLISLSYAIVIRHDVDDGKYQRLGREVKPLVTFVFASEQKQTVVGSGTYLGQGWVVTAAHVAHYLNSDITAHMQGFESVVARVFIHPKRKEGEAPYDIALVRLEDRSLSAPQANMYKAIDEKGLIVTFAGRGDFGTGKDGVVNAYQVLRGARNQVTDVTPQWLKFVFDEPGKALALEGISGPGDSGGPALIKVDGQWRLLGVSAWQDSQRTNWQEGKYQVVEYYSRISTFSPWLEEVMGKEN